MFTFQAKMTFKYLALFPFSLLLISCSASTDLERRMARLEQSVNATRSIQASQKSDIEAMQTEVRSLTGRLDELQHFQDQRIGREVAVLRDDISSLKGRVPPPTIIPLSALDIDETELHEIASEGSRIVLDSIVFLRDAKFREAQALNQNALEFGKQDAAYPYALFWGGVIADGLGDNPAALRSYNELIVQLPKHNRAPLALLRQADVFLRLRDKTAATFALKKLLSDYPKSPEAAAAKQKLSELSRR
jgi:TolA-binding protein